MEELENALRTQWAGTTIGGYRLQNVLLTTHVRSYEVLGSVMEDNLEAQDAKSKAGTIRAVAFTMQYDDRIVQAMVSANGDVTFLNYPGDRVALGFLEQLEPFIDANADPTLVSVR